jgi:hypothetical protein
VNAVDVSGGVRRVEDEDLFFTIHATLASKPAYKSELVRVLELWSAFITLIRFGRLQVTKTKNPKWAPLRQWRQVDLCADTSCIVRVWAHRRFGRNVLLFERQIELTKLTRWNPVRCG